MNDRTNYFVAVYITMLVVVLAAFSPTFFLRNYVQQPPVLAMPQLPTAFIVHGIILTAWYSFLVLQSGLIRVRKVRTHQMLGIAGMGLAAAVVASTVVIVYRFPGRMKDLSQQLGIGIDELEPGLSVILWMDIFLIVLFVGLMTVGFLKRRRPEVHKRVMVYAGITFLFAATARLGSIVSDAVVADAGLIVNFGLLIGLTVSLLIYDKWATGRVTLTSWTCFLSYWLAKGSGIFVGSTEWGRSTIGL